MTEDVLTSPDHGLQHVIDESGLQALVDALRNRGFTVLGPTVRNGAVVHAEIGSVDDLPRGWGDEQDGARYRLRRRGDDALFAFATSVQSWKSLLFPSRTLLWRGERDAGEGTDGAAGGFSVDGPDDAAAERRYALLGVRPCDLAAVQVHDRVLRDRAHVDAGYVTRRDGLFVVALTCSDPAGTCFCVSMGTGPSPGSGYDLALTELLEDAEGPHRFVVTEGSARGAEVLASLATSAAGDADVTAADAVAAQARERMGRVMDTSGIRELLYANAEHPRWDDVAERCLSCGNCTMVCPTCFCTTVEDATDLTGGQAERWRVWDSCFTGDFSHLHGGSVRQTTHARYRQWMTHKLASWFDQFGTSGCVGCGRCITWCPVAIDITEEVRAIRETSDSPGGELATPDTPPPAGGDR